MTPSPRKSTGRLARTRALCPAPGCGAAGGGAGSLSYRTLDTEEEQLRLLATDGMLVKRPLLITQDKVLPGFKPREWESVL